MIDNIFKSIKRKAIIAAPTMCRYCRRKFLDKWYKDEGKHKVICEHCGKINAEVDVDDWMKLYWQGIRHSIGTYGAVGFHVESGKFKKAVKEAYGFETDEEVKEKLRQFEYGVEMKKRHTKVTLKRKGEEEKTL